MGQIKLRAPVNSALLQPRTAFANAEEKKEPPEAALPRQPTRCEPPFQPLEPATRFA